MSTTIFDYTTEAERLVAEKPELFLGQLVSFTIAGADVPLETVRAELEARNLSTTSLRKRLRPIDAFKKATNEIGEKWQRDGDEQHSILVRQVGADGNASHRHIVWERAEFTPGKRRRLVYTPLATIVYDRGVRKGDLVENDSITVTSAQPVGTVIPACIKQQLDQTLGDSGAVLQERFEHWKTHLDSHAVRTLVRDYLVEEKGAVSVKDNGGFYFVDQKHSDEVRDLREFVRSLPQPTRGKGSSMQLVPLLNIGEQKQFIAESFLADTNDAVKVLLAEISKILADPDRTITQATYDEKMEQAAFLLSKTADYQSLLGDHLDTTDLTVQILRNQVLSTEFQNRIKQPKSMSRTTA